MPQVLTPAVEPALLLDAEVQLWLSGGAFRTGRTIAALIADGSLSPTGAVVGSAIDTYTTNANLTTAIPIDDTIPQVGEGTQILSVSLTPKSLTNKIRVRFSGAGATSAAGGNVVTAAMFVNGAADAVRATTNVSTAANTIMNFVMEFEYVPASLTAQTITIRVGPNTGTARMNGTSAARFLGGSMGCVVVAEEIKA